MLILAQRAPLYENKISYDHERARKINFRGPCGLIIPRLVDIVLEGYSDSQLLGL
jgi:hypothetical protein